MTNYIKISTPILLICMQHTAQTGGESMQFAGNTNQHGSSKWKSLKSLLEIHDHYLSRNVAYLHYDL